MLNNQTTISEQAKVTMEILYAKEETTTHNENHGDNEDRDDGTGPDETPRLVIDNSVAVLMPKAAA